MLRPFFSYEELMNYGGLLVFLLIGIFFSCLFMILARLRGGSRPYAEKNSPYECGFSPMGSLDAPFSIRFALVAILFVIFDIEIALLFPWALTFRQLGWPGFISVLCFLSILAVGFVYEWCSGALDWE